MSKEYRASALGEIESYMRDLQDRVSELETKVGVLEKDKEPDRTALKDVIRANSKALERNIQALNRLNK